MGRGVQLAPWADEIPEGSIRHSYRLTGHVVGPQSRLMDHALGSQCRYVRAVFKARVRCFKGVASKLRRTNERGCRAM